MARRHELEEVAQEVRLAQALGRPARPALLGDEGEQVLRGGAAALGLPGLPGLPGLCDLPVAVPDELQDRGVEPVHGEHEVPVRLERQPADREEAVGEQQDLPEPPRGKELRVGLVERAAPLEQVRLLLVGVSKVVEIISGLYVVQIYAEKHRAHLTHYACQHFRTPKMMLNAKNPPKRKLCLLGWLRGEV